MRLVLAVLVILAHAPTIAIGEKAGQDFFEHPLALPLKFVLPAFFTLSGFLVAGSMQRCRTLLSFLGLRFLRIYPALIVEVTLSALLIGPLVTEISLREYFSSPVFFRYLLNVTGHISYYLPGVFLSNPKPAMVNWQLWTVPWELICYIAITLMILVGVKKHRHRAIVATAIIFLIALIKQIRSPEGLSVLHGHAWGHVLVVYFASGVLAYLYKERLPYNAKLFFVSALSALIAFGLLPAGQLLGIPPLVYCVIYLGVCNPRQMLPASVVDCSYGMYLYGYVLQQLIALEAPWSRTILWNFVIAVGLSLVVGLASWHLVERPALNLRGHLRSLEDWWLNTSKLAAAPD
ncbi:acyltransferase [Bradyrhizobium sp. LVM 105]|nr:acyltransferase [Bradyrhizobium sp. LVM 105]